MIDFVRQAHAMKERPNWDLYGLCIAEAVSLRADCTRRKVGAVIFDKNHRIVSTGYNGSPPGGPSCLSGLCPRGKHFELPPEDEFVAYAQEALWTLCACGNQWPCTDAVAPTSSYDTGAGTCIALHAEQNAIVFADPGRLQGSTMYCTDDPCDGCNRLILGVGIARVITPGLLDAWGGEAPPAGHSYKDWLAEGNEPS